MKYFWALLSTLALSSTVVATGVAAGAATTPETATLDSAEPSSAASASAAPTVAAGGFHWQLTAPQTVVPGTVLMSTTGKHKGSHGTRSDRQFYEISHTGSNDVPEAALRAYHHAATVMAKTDPGCHISWTLLAAIGRVESNHGRFAGAQLGSDGVSRPEIRGPQLNGAGAFAAIHDSDNGTLDRDKVWDRAVGQMQFLPQTWRAVARDGDDDGKMNPDDIDDSALGSAVYLCGAGGSLADAAGMSRAAFRYNHSDYYVQLVLSFQTGYQTGVFAVPSPPPPAPKKKAAAVKHKTANQINNPDTSSH
jgi:membrane-bound lytic murein transglycosylase B